MARLHLAEGLALPLEAITQTFGILAVRGAGKSYAAAVMAEEMFAAKLPFVVVDPVGAWWGLRSAGDGSSAGLSVPIFGGAHGDVPLEKSAGQLVADLVVQDRLSCVLDVSDFSETDKIRFLIDFAERLYRRNRDPLHLFLEEADDYAPQRPFREQARLLRAWENMIRRGRARGLGITMITQRSAALNKNVLTQIETLLVLRTTSPQDRKAIGAWIEYHGEAREVLESLPALEAGEAWLWSPSWLRTMRRVRIRRRWTFDSAATPKNVRGSRPPTSLADVDLRAITKRMAATIERAKADDPRELRRRVHQLEHELAAARKADPPASAPERVEVPVIKDSQIRGMEAVAGKLEKSTLRLVDVTAVLGSAVRDLREALSRLNGRAVPTPVVARAGVARPARVMRTTPARPPPRDTPAAADPLSKGERAVLVAAGQHEAGVGKNQLSVLTGYKRSSRDTYIQRLRTRGLVEIAGKDMVITPAGRAALGADWDPLPTGDALRRYWVERLPVGERRVLEVLLAAYPDGVERAALGEITDYQRSSRDTYLQRLRARRLVEVLDRGLIRASKDLFSERRP